MLMFGGTTGWPNASLYLYTIRLLLSYDLNGKCRAGRVGRIMVVVVAVCVRPRINSCRVHLLKIPRNSVWQ